MKLNPFRVVIIIIFVSLVALSCGREKRSVPEGPNVLLVTFDTVRADHLGCYGNKEATTPVLDALAQEGVLFEQCASPCPITLPAHASILTGLYPPHHEVRNNGSYTLPEDKITLAEILYDAGYKTASFVSAHVLDNQYGLSQGFHVYDDSISESTAEVAIHIAERSAKDVTDAALDWLSERRKRPFFLWIHYYDPHVLYDPPQEYRDRFPNDYYSGEIAYADHELGRIIEKIDRAKTLIVFTADHGESLGEHGEETHAFFVYDSTLHVPLIVVRPDNTEKGSRVKKQVSLVDIVPTILETLGLPMPGKLDGTDLFNDKKNDATRSVYFETVYPLSFKWSPLAGFRTLEYHYIQAPRVELYRVSEDPLEKTNIADSNKAIADGFQKQLVEMNPLASMRDSKAKRALTAEDRNLLTTLGYVGDGNADAPLDFASLPDPKDKIGDYTKSLNARRDFFSGDYPKAASQFIELASAYPKLSQFHFMLGKSFDQMGEYSKAVDAFQKALDLDRGDPSFWGALATECNKAGDFSIAQRICSEGMTLFPDEASLYDQLGLSHKMAGNLPEAIKNGEKAVSLSPEQPEYLNNLGASYLADKKIDKASDALNKALSFKKDFPQCLYNLGIVELQRKNYAEAEIHLRRATSVDPKNLDAWIQLNKVLLYLKRSDDAIKTSLHILELQPDNLEAQYFMGTAYRQQKDFAKAEGCFRLFLQKKPDSAPACQELCEVLLAQGKDKSAEARQIALDARSKGMKLPDDLLAKLALQGGG